MKIIRISFILALIFSGCFLFTPDVELKSIDNWAYQLQDMNPSEVISAGYDLIVTDYSKDGTDEQKYTQDELEDLKQKGVIPIAYLSIGEAEDYRFYWKDNWNDSKPNFIGKENSEWKGNYAVKYWDKDWQSIVFEYIDTILSQGFKGLYLDKIDEFEYWSNEENADDTVLTEEDAARLMIDFVEKISQYCRTKDEDFYIIPQNGENIIDYDDNSRYINAISGIGVEDLFYNEKEPNDTEYVNFRLKYLRKLRERNRIVLSVDYVDDKSGYEGENKSRINDYILKCKREGFLYYVATTDRLLDCLNHRY